ncbi:MAG: Holliday junction branch migration protein RuvA, partial [Oscillospiraceae bacterium]|nr:Holliday junction branch migration protein RuvA [Oscillospiraceae bacterium]
LTIAPGIGKKIAQRIILELKDKLAKEQQSGGFVPAAAAASGGGKAVEAAQALAVLGYSQSDVAAAMKGLDVDALPLEEIVRQALRRMVK